MPGIAQKFDACGGSNGDVYHSSLVGNGALPYESFNGSSMANDDFWSKQRDDTCYNQLHKFWCELTIQARQKLMRIDKQTLFEHARKNMYCSRCNGLLLEGFLQIVLYGKSLQKDGISSHGSGQVLNNCNCGDMSNDNECQVNVIDPSLHPWGGLTTAKDGTLTLLDPYLHSKSLKGLQNVLDSARARERERKLLYPDACGGGNRGWISQGMPGYGRGHGTRETCALHTARLSVETLVDFWSALGEETRQSLLRMKEEDFIERLVYRFDRKRFCRDCRRNVIREFKELKELKRMRKDPRCTSWFCVADSVFKCEVSRDTVRADWHQMLLDPCGTYHHFEWAIGTGEGKSDILDFKNVGLSVRVQVNGLDLSGLCVCYITLRAWKIDGQCNELCVKAHALRGPQCVHCRLAVGDGSVTITLGINIRGFFEHAEEAEKEEDDDSMDKDGNELDGECPRPQKHAKSPQLAREFLLDAATVIFKEQVEKAFREGTVRQNARSIFICLALKLLEERVHVACKEIFTLEKQMKLLEEEEREKREEEERKERRRTKEREKKMRRRERLREKETKEKKCAESTIDDAVPDTLNEEKPCIDEGVDIGKTRDCVKATGEATRAGSLLSPDIQDDQFLIEFGFENMEDHPEDDVNGEPSIISDLNTYLPYSYYYSRRKQRLRKDTEQDPTSKSSDRRKGASLSESEPTISNYESRFHADGFESTRGINCLNKQLRTNAAKFNTRNGQKLSEKSESTNHRVSGRCNSHVCSCNHHNDLRSTREPKASRHENWRVKASTTASNSHVTKKVWEPLDSQKKCVQSNLVSDVAFKPKVETSSVYTDISVDTNNEDNRGNETCRDTVIGFHSKEKLETYKKVEEVEDDELCFITRSPQRTVDSLLRSSSNSDNCSSCLSEGDSNISSNRLNPESTSTSDSEESSQTSEGRDMLHCLGNGFSECHKIVDDRSTTVRKDANNQEPASGATNSLSNLPAETDINCEIGKENAGVNAQSQSVLPPMMHNPNIHYPVFQAPAMAYYSPVSWPADPTNGLMPFHYNHYLFANSFGYDLNTNPQLMQYGGLHHPPPLINPVHLPVFPTVPQANAVPTTDHGDPGAVKLQHSIPDGGQNGKPDTTDKGNTDFSLFHFGGPVALSAGFKAEPGAVGDSSDGNKKDSIEEYNLFASSNGIKFSIL